MVGRSSPSKQDRFHPKRKKTIVARHDISGKFASSLQRYVKSGNRRGRVEMDKKKNDHQGLPSRSKGSPRRDAHAN
jgi:hypothetical protein